MSNSNKVQEILVENEYLKLAIDTIRLNGIAEKVSTIHRSFENKAEKAIVRSLYKVSLRVAAIFILVIGSSSFYKYMSTNDQSVYNKQFISYELTNTRGEQKRENETEAYRSKNWNAVIAIYQSENIKSDKYSFLAAMAELQLNHFPEAVYLLEQVLHSTSTDHSFREEAEYYLSLAYLMNHQENKGIQLMQKIRTDASHVYYPLASRLSDIDLKIIALKK